MSVDHCPSCHSPIAGKETHLDCDHCGLVVLGQGQQIRKTDIQARNKALTVFIDALKIIAKHGGTQAEEGLSCNGSWCAEQAIAALRKVRIE